MPRESPFQDSIATLLPFYCRTERFSLRGSSPLHAEPGFVVTAVLFPVSRLLATVCSFQWGDKAGQGYAKCCTATSEFFFQTLL